MNNSDIITYDKIYINDVKSLYFVVNLRKLISTLRVFFSIFLALAARASGLMLTPSELNIL
jgi:hypothetical protein